MVRRGDTRQEISRTRGPAIRRHPGAPARLADSQSAARGGLSAVSLRFRTVVHAHQPRLPASGDIAAGTVVAYRETALKHGSIRSALPVAPAKPLALREQRLV